MRKLKLLTEYVLITKYTKMTDNYSVFDLDLVVESTKSLVMSLYGSLPLTAELHRTLQCCSAYVYQAHCRVRTAKAVCMDGLFAFCAL